MKYIFIILIPMICLSVTAQDTTISKRNISKIFRDNAKGTTFDWNKREWSEDYNQVHLDKHNSWTACNTDSSYYHSDTITLYNHNLFYPQLDCHWLKEWHIGPRKQITVMDTKPPMGVVTPAAEYRITQEGANVYIEITDDDQLVDRFCVLNLSIVYLDDQKEERCYRMTLKRAMK